MARSTSIKRATTRSPRQQYRVSLTENFRFGESYTSLILGIIVVILMSILIVSVIKGLNGRNFHPKQDIAFQKIELKNPVASNTQAKQSNQTTYTVAAGDDLWNIAEKFYKNGYAWKDIAKANNLTNPSTIFAGNTLIIPKIAANTAPSETIAMSQSPPQQTITGSTYTVAKGDDLWDIAVKVYGDGYQWVKIAKENNLDNPGLIFSGNVLKIPR